jgi:integrase/recombinase XerD
MHIIPCMCPGDNNGGVNMYSNSKDEVIIALVGRLTVEFKELGKELDFQDQLKIRAVAEEVLYKFDVVPQETALVASDIEDKMQMYIAVRRLEGLSEKTLKNYEYELLNFADHLRKPLATVNVTDLRVYLAVRCKGLKPGTTNTIMSYLKTFFTWLRDEEYIPTNPSSKLKPTKEPKRVRQAMSKKEIEQIRLACITPREKALVNFLYSTGCRLSEVVGVNKSDINWAERTLFVIGKGNKEREVCFDTTAELHLQNYLETRTDECDALFVTERRPYGRLGARAIQKVIKDVAERTGIKKSIYPHLFRHSFATHRLNSGAPLHMVQGWLGHSDPATTQIYASASRESLINEYRRIS